MRILRVGDPHVRPSNIDESEKLFEFIASTALSEKVDRIELLGDLFHTHSVLRLEVVEFWDNWLDRLSDICQVVVLIGNHDMSGDYHSSSHALSVFYRIKKTNLQIVELPFISGKIGYLPYYHDREKFVEEANFLGVNTLVCHQTFSGSTYENGFYAQDGVNPDLLNVKQIISGHIHKEQTLGKVIYPGTARWDSASDANEDKGIWIFEHDNNGSILGSKKISTAHVCQPLISLVWLEGTDAPVIPENSRTMVECIGSSTFIAQAKALFKGKVKLKTKITDKPSRSKRKTSVSVLDFLDNSYVTKVNKEKLKAYLKEKQYV